MVSSCDTKGNITEQVNSIAYSNLSRAIFIYMEPVLLQAETNRSACVATSENEAADFRNHVKLYLNGILHFWSGKLYRSYPLQIATKSKKLLKHFEKQKANLIVHNLFVTIILK